MADLIVDNKFPCHALVPKNETGALNFLKKYPQFDGKDVTIAIFDSGVDPRATGLKTTLHGDTKVIERFDCTGCGDVDMSKKVTATADGYITGLSGKNLKVSKFMKTCNTSGDEYRVGLKSLFDLYPSKVRDKIIAENKNKKWDEPQKKVVADILREIDSFETKNSSNLTTLPLREKLKKENLDSSIEILNFFEKKYSEFKTTYDCILFPGEKSWIAVLDTTETGDLENALCINEYTKTHDIQSINDFLSISVNIHNEGNVLEIVGMCSSHGTHVASIASGYHADNRELDGLAPGSKIVSLTIGDGRLGSMETGTALVRAIIKIMELCNSGLKIDVINMSYGEHAHWSNGGRIGELMNEVVNKYGVVWVASAGNHGPALCTIGTPPDISQPSCIGVGAYVSRDMMEAEYTLRSKYSDVYTWTSRDPCIDGGSGVTVCAPGAAIASVPEFTMSKAQLMNGTSMAAPHVAGAVALLISGLKQKGIAYSPYSIKRALWNTATTLTTIDSFAQGNGLLNVEKAFENLISFSTEPETNIRFAVSVGNNNDKGIHMRQGILTKPEEFNVTVEPVFFNDKEISPREKINFNIRITLVPSAEWIQCGTYLDLCYSPRSFIVRVDPTGLRGSLFQASVKAYDSSNIEKGVLFEIPITVVQPTVINIEKILVLRTGDYLFTPNTIVRHFILVPKYATWAVLKMKSDHVGGKFLVHTMQILPSKYCKALETQKILPLSNEFETVHPFKCESDNVLEICVAKYWSNLGQTYVSKCLEFHGVYANGGNVMHAANGIHRMDVRALKVEEILPSISLKNAVMILKPSESKISPLTSRDVLPPCRQIYQNILTFNLHLAKQQEMSLHAPLFSSVLYESEFESQFWMIFDTNKMMIGCGDAYSNNNYIKLEKGDYVIRLQVRHEKKELLEKISDTNMLAGFKLSNPLCPDIYKTFNAAATGGKKITAFQLTNKTTKPIYVAPLSAEKITKAGLPSQCSWLEGTITFAKDEIGRKVDISPFQYILVEGPSVKKGNGTPKETKTKLEEYKDGLRDFQNMMIPKLDLEKAEEVYKELITNNPNFLAAHISMIQNLDSSEIKSQLPFTFKQLLEEMEDQKALKNVLQRIFDLSNTVIINTDVDALLSYYGLKSDTRSDAAKIKINMDKQKVTLLEAYSKKMIAYSKLHLMDPKTAEETDILDEIDKIYSGIGRFIDYNDTKVLNACVWHAFMHNHYGRMSKYLQKLYEEKLQREILEELCYVVKEIDWYHVQNVIEKIIVNTNPQGYRLF